MSNLIVDVGFRLSQLCATPWTPTPMGFFQARILVLHSQGMEPEAVSPFTCTTEHNEAREH